MFDAWLMIAKQRNASGTFVSLLHCCIDVMIDGIVDDAHVDYV